MNKLLPLLLLLAIAGVAWLVLGDSDGEHSEDWDQDALDESARRDETDPTLLGASGAGPRAPRSDASGKSPSAQEPERPAGTQWLYLQGTVKAQEGGAPIAGARLWVEPVGTPCPRIPRHAQAWTPTPGGANDVIQPRIVVGSDGTVDVGAGVPPPPPSVVTDASGRFRWMVDEWLIPRSAQFDVFVQAKGFVTGVRCRPAGGDDITILLVRALRLPIHVTDRQQRPLEGVSLSVKPAPGTEALPGHAGAAVTDREGNAEIDGLLAGQILVTADHREFMPQTTAPLDPAKQQTLSLQLAPAFRLSFEIRSDDGSSVENPVLSWQTDGAPPSTGLLLLAASPSGPSATPRAEVQTEAVRIPCEHRNVQIELKADGFQPWRPEPEPLPVSGGARKIIASLTRDSSLSSLTVRFEDEQGEAVSAREIGVTVDPPLAPLDGQKLGSFTVVADEALVFTSLPTGRYRFGLLSARYAPAEVEATLAAGEGNEQLVRLTQPARLRIKFLAAEQLVVTFRLRTGERVLPAFPLNEDGEPASKSGPLQANGNEGALFGGLPGGSCTIEVVSEDLVASSTSVNLHTGETTEIEIEVSRR